MEEVTEKKLSRKQTGSIYLILVILIWLGYTLIAMFTDN